jgi:hypothetical protein
LAVYVPKQKCFKVLRDENFSGENNSKEHELNEARKEERHLKVIKKWHSKELKHKS